jgi:hypothetical protein
MLDTCDIWEAIECQKGLILAGHEAELRFYDRYVKEEKFYEYHWEVVDLGKR